MNATQRQSGASLVISLVMLLVLTLLVVSAIRSNNTNLRIAGNVQAKAEATAAAQQAIEQVISTTEIFTARAARTIAVGRYTVEVGAPECRTSKVVENDTSSDINPNILVDSAGGGASATDFLYTFWDIPATVNDTASGTSVVVHQGVKLVLPATPNPCP